jgi:hypothetical protein
MRSPRLFDRTLNQSEVFLLRPGIVLIVGEKA